MGKYRFEDLSEEDLRHLVQSLEDSDIPIFLVEPDNNKVVFANSAWMNHAPSLYTNFSRGMPLEEALAIETQTLAPLLADDVKKKITKSFCDSIRAGGTYEFGGPDGKLYRGQYSKSGDNGTLGISFDVTELKKQRAETTRARKALESTLEGLHHGVMLYDKTGHVQYYNRSFKQTTESLNIHIETGMSHIALRNQLPDTLQNKLKVSERVDLEDFEFVQKAPNGKHYLFESRRLSNGDILVSTVDVSELEQNREETRKIRETLEKTLQGLIHGVMLIDGSGYVTYCNDSIKSFAQDTNVTIDVGVHVSEIRANVPHQDPESIADPSQDFEYVVQGDNGKSFMVRRRYLENVGILISTVDITELSEKRAQLKRVKETFEKSLDGLPHGVLLYNRSGHVEFFNSEFEETVRPMGMEVSKGMSFMEVSTQVPDSFRRELLGHEPGQPFELVQTRFGGQSYLIEGRPIEGVGFMVTTVEVTDLQNALEAAKAADVAKTSFLANMSHEIRTPMNGVLGMAQVLEHSAIDEHQKKCINIIKNSSEMLLRIINDILDISKLDAERINIEQEPLDIEDILQKAIGIVRPNLLAKPNVEIINNMGQRTPHLHIGDAGRIRQILINLLSNGVKFTHEGHVKISTSFTALNDEHDQIVFRVEDTGIGIPDDKRDKIFERFEQSDNSTTREYGGTGLGLAISKRLTDLMDGQLSVCRDYCGGACFELSLPLKKGPKSTPTKLPVIRSFKQTPILIIDDNEVNHMVLTNQLKPLRIKPYCVSSAKQGLAILRRAAEKNFQLPLVICDYQMPGQTGLDFVKALKADPSIAETPVMILSSADILARKKDFVALGVTTIMEKPCSNVEIVASVSKILFEARATKATKNRPAVKTRKTVKTSDRILVADDDPVNREVFRGLITLFGYDCDIVDNGLEAVKAFTENEYDLVVMDISMPVLGGIGATEKIRHFENRTHRHPTAIIAATAHALKGDREKFLAHGMSDYISKPVLKADFEKILKTWLSKRPADRAVA